jgi:peroxiredoxin
MKRANGFVSVKVLILLLVVVQLFPRVVEARAPRIGEKIAALSLPDLGGKRVTTAAQGGKSLVVYFWTDACGCREQLIELKAYVSGLKSRQCTFLAVNAGQEKSRVERFVAETGIAYQVLLDEKSRVARDQFGVKVLPTIFIIDRNGVLREKLIGVVDTKKLQSLINRYL